MPSQKQTKQNKTPHKKQKYYQEKFGLSSKISLRSVENPSLLLATIGSFSVHANPELSGLSLPLARPPEGCWMGRWEHSLLSLDPFSALQHPPCSVLPAGPEPRPSLESAEQVTS